MKKGVSGSGRRKASRIRRFPPEGSASVELTGNRRHLGFPEPFSFARGSGRGPWSAHPLARPLQDRDDGAPATKGVREDLELASAPLRACRVEGFPDRCDGTLGCRNRAPARQHTARGSRASAPDHRRAKKTRSLARFGRSPACSRVVIDKQKSTGSAWLAQAVPGCGWEWRTEPSFDAGDRDAAKGRRGNGSSRKRDGSGPGLRVELPVGGKCSGSRNPVSLHGGR